MGGRADARRENTVQDVCTVIPVRQEKRSLETSLKHESGPRVPRLPKAHPPILTDDERAAVIDLVAKLTARGFKVELHATGMIYADHAIEVRVLKPVVVYRLARLENARSATVALERVLNAITEEAA
jgi:hypothetical protein